ncbi:molecular chaperone [Trinickia sp. EG282A]|uniref:molecular chaperone n=1 Tax=Trinickia sp. EG282A TaxID=3237013 RepID=UPI0034D22D8B
MMIRAIRLLARAATGAALVSTCAISHAANFTVTPVRVELSPSQTSSALTVKNEMTDEPVVVELNTVAWSQKDGEDVYTPAPELLATPPIFTLAPGATQVIRIGLRHPSASDRETTYRLYLREVPPPPKPGFAGVQIALEMRLPIFVKPRVATAPALQWHVDRQGSGPLALSVTNEGTAHAQVANLVLTAGDRPVATYPGFAYVLPGQTRRLVMQPGRDAPSAPGGALRLKAYSDAGDIDSPIAQQWQ